MTAKPPGATASEFFLMFHLPVPAAAANIAADQ